MTRKSHEPSLGSISHGTLRTADLLVAFADELEWVKPRGNAKLIHNARIVARYLERDGCKGRDPKIIRDNRANAMTYNDTADSLAEQLQDKLSACAPPFTYFGTNAGDGADFGWWPDMYAIDELPTEVDDEKLFGEFKTVSDHGNVEVYYRSRNGRVKSIIGVV